MPAMGKSGDARLLWLAVASAEGAVSIDVLAESGLWRASELFALIEDARSRALIAPDPEAGPGHLRWTDAERRTETLAEATGEEFNALLAHAPFPDLVLAAARGAVRAREFRRASILYKAVANAPDRSLFAEGEGAWVAAVIESIRTFRSVWAASAENVDAALALAESRGDLASQVTLLGARGLQVMPQYAARAAEMFERATEAAEAIGDAARLGEIRTYIAVGLVLNGRLREGIAAFEEMLGDVPVDLSDPKGPMLDLDGAAPASALGILSSAYVYVGDHPRALDILERVRARGAELENHAVEKLARLFLAMTYAILGEADVARPHAEAAYAYFGAGLEISYAWYAAIALAWVRVEEGRFDEAREALERGLPAWHRAGRPWVGGSRALELLERLEAAGVAPVEGLTVDGEIERHLETAHAFLRGVAHRYRARRLLAREGVPARERAAAHLEQAIAALRAAGGRPELRLALAEAAELAAQRGRDADAARLRSEQAELAPAVPVVRRASPADVVRLATAVVDLGRLGALAPRREGLWGEVVARLCRDFGVERCAIVEAVQDGPKVIAMRGGTEWAEALVARLRDEAPSAPVFLPALAKQGAPDGGGQLVLVPFADEEIGRRGVVALENRETAPTVGPGDETLLRALARQIATLLANFGLWRELIEARQRLEQENRYYREAPTASIASGRIVGNSAAMREVLELVRRVSPSTTPVLVTGETGVGKELVSHEVHLLSPRKARPFIAVHVAALAPGLVASALFGHERGAFTGATEQSKGRFELADCGTLFLDEIGELSLENQVRLLRVLQEGTFERVGGTRVIRSDFRLVAATNRDLAAEVRAGRFREDLYFRLNAFPIRVPPLRERREEIPTLALFFMERASRKLGVQFEGIPEADMERLVAYAWPGNVRELEHVIERAALLSDPPRLRIPALDAGVVPAATGVAAQLRAAAGAVEDWVTLEEIERRYIRKVLRHVDGRVSGEGGAADILGLKPSTLQFWVDKLGLREDLKRARENKARA